MGVHFAPGWYQQDFFDSDLEKLKELQDLDSLESFSFLTFRQVTV